MAAANAIASLADSGRNGSSSSLSSAGMSNRDGGGGRPGVGVDYGGVAGRGPPVAPQCDYVVDKVLGRKVFLVPVCGVFFVSEGVALVLDFGLVVTFVVGGVLYLLC